MLSNGWNLVHSHYRRHTISYGTRWLCECGKQAPCGHGTYGHSVVTACTQHTGPVTLWTWHQVDGHHMAHSTGLMGTEHAHRVRCTWSPCRHCVNTAHTVAVWPQHDTVAVWPQYTDTVPTWCVLSPCGYGTQICSHTDTIPTWYVLSPCGYGMQISCPDNTNGCCVAKVHARCHAPNVFGTVDMEKVSR